MRHKGTQGATMTSQLSPERAKRNARIKAREENYWKSLASDVKIICGDHLVPIKECGCRP
jgi:hypothetical protein